MERKDDKKYGSLKLKKIGFLVQSTSELSSNELTTILYTLWLQDRHQTKQLNVTTNTKKTTANVLSTLTTTALICFCRNSSSGFRLFRLFKNILMISIRKTVNSRQNTGTTRGKYSHSTASAYPNLKVTPTAVATTANSTYAIKNTKTRRVNGKFFFIYFLSRMRA